MQECYRKDKHPLYSVVADVATIFFLRRVKGSNDIQIGETKPEIISDYGHSSYCENK
jgi:hypothetical protein